jgi:predicted membrane-bound spermidine synthase
MRLYAPTAFLSAFLLFQVQPLIARRVLPWFGGSPAVWTTAVLFFQILLLAGYGYVHATSARLVPRLQAALHAALLIASVAFLPIVPDVSWKPASPLQPTLRVLALLAGTVGLPYFVLSTTGPLVQRWLSLTDSELPPYRIYALSNLGSLLALLSYPFLVEPALGLVAQAWAWSGGYAAFACASALCALRVFRAPLPRLVAAAAGSEDPTADDSARPTAADVAMWVGLAALPSALLLAVTSHLSQDVAAVPFLWVLPLSLYLLSFILAFESQRWYRRAAWTPAAFISAAAATVFLFVSSEVPLWTQIAVYSAALLCASMLCHGELSRSRPPARSLTAFYLALAFGGALGGAFVVVAAPLLFRRYAELHVALAGSLALALAAAWRHSRGRLAPRTGRSRRARWALAAVLVVLACALAADLLRGTDSVVERTRNFYGILTVVRGTDAHGGYLSLRHGQIEHGLQYLADRERTRRTGYYGDESGVGLVIRFLAERRSSLRIGVVGLGVGTIASYGRPGDVIRFYEINPEVVRLARERFSYLSESPAHVEVVLGDARLALERELEGGAPQGYDVLAVDAFSGDAIPMHLATRECFELYWKHVASEGVLAFHISNLYVDLRPVLHTLAGDSGVPVVTVDWDNPPRGSPQYDPALSDSRWILATRNQGLLDDPRLRARTVPWPERARARVLWTDDFGSLRQVLKH